VSRNGFGWFVLGTSSMFKARVEKHIALRRSAMLEMVRGL